MSTVFALLILLTFSHSLVGGLLMAGLCLAILVTIAYTDRNLFDGTVKRNFLILSILVILIAVVMGASASRPAPSQFNVAGFFTQLGEPWGWFTLLGFTLANLLWQYSEAQSPKPLGIEPV